MFLLLHIFGFPKIAKYRDGFATLDPVRRFESFLIHFVRLKSLKLENSQLLFGMASNLRGASNEKSN